MSLTLLTDMVVGGSVDIDAFDDENISSSLINPITKLISCDVTIIAAVCFCADDGEMNGVNNVFNIYKLVLIRRLSKYDVELVHCCLKNGIAFD